ncbi:hypothetical protein [Noviherbaspirillum galbum]|uniref:Uncharacterized protein n=1 Tax=Noviherbaspirillum galbum TaxID=2709383 RepID=A0A6B3SXY6_9BURK|nr:hypothetical protein [Noviherbaspirillum galbum]NEX63432.1 hypothetical protein [Noviherbaspirillum galbum]
MTRQPRRRLLQVALFAAFGVPAWTNAATVPVPIVVDTRGVTDVRDLAARIRKAAGNRLPATLPDQAFYTAFATAFVSHAHEAADMGAKVPAWILDALPRRKVAALAPGPVLIWIGRLLFALVLEDLYRAVVGSMGLMQNDLVRAVQNLAEKTKTAA